jgi:hypothetical protein
MSLVADPDAVEIGSHAWCWARLEASSEGVLWFWGARGRIVVGASYTSTSQQITVAADPFDAVGWSAAGHELTLEIRGTGPVDLRWLVRATGLARHPSPPLDQAAGAEPHGLLLPSVRVRGLLGEQRPERTSQRRPTVDETRS